jgi:hypothetical protein
MDVVSAASIELAGRTSADVDLPVADLEYALREQFGRHSDFSVKARKLRLTEGRRLRVGVRRDTGVRGLGAADIALYPLSTGGTHVTWSLPAEQPGSSPEHFERDRRMNRIFMLTALALFLGQVSLLPSILGTQGWAALALPGVLLLNVVAHGFVAFKARPEVIGLTASEIARAHEALHAALTGAEGPRSEPGQLSLAEPSTAGELSLSAARP